MRAIFLSARLLGCLLFLSSVASAPGFAQGNTDVIRGQVTDSAGTVLQNAVVVAIDSLGTQREAKTDRNGRYSIVVPNGSGVYILQVTAIGMAPGRRQIRREADEAILVADFTLGLTREARKQANQQGNGSRDLNAVQVIGRKKAERDIAPTGKPGDAEELLIGSGGRGLSPDQQGDLTKIAGSTPGMVLTPDGYSVMGMGADQNNALLDGLQVSGLQLPRAASVVGALSTTTFDPARGGFSGGQMSLMLRSGSNYVQRRMNFALDLPQLQFADPVARRLGQKYSNFRLSWGGTGPIVEDKLFYNLSWDIGRRSSELQSLGLDNVGALQRIGIATDSAARLFDLLQQENIPIAPGDPPSTNSNTRISLLSRIDYIPQRSNNSFSLTLSANIDRSPASMTTSSAVLGHGGRTSGQGWMIQFGSVNYFRGAFLNEFRAGGSIDRRSMSPYVALPDGRVRVASTLPDGTLGNTTVLFGGNAGLPTESHGWSWEIMNQTSWYSMDNSHRLALTFNSRIEGMSQRQFQNRFGTYTYNSLEDFERGQPASFTRTFGGIESDARVWQIAAALGDRWRIKNSFELQYGLRIEGNRYLTTPAYNALLDSLLNVRTDVVPNTFAIVPRLGFLWTYKRARQGRSRPYIGSGGTLNAVAVFIPPHTLGGGIGIFRNGFSPGLVSTILRSTGLPDAQRQLTCLGEEIPTPDWERFTSDLSLVPSTCVSGQIPTPLANASPGVSVYDPSYTASKSVRANLAWGFTLWEQLAVRFEDIVSVGLAQRGVVDVNFANVQHFTLENEGGRPVFVAPDNIVEATGAVSFNASRRVSSFSRVLSTNANLRTKANQFRVSLSTFNTFRSWSASATYIRMDTRNQTLGFSGSTAGNPLIAEWGPADFAGTHQLYMMLSRRFGAVLGVIYGNVSSGDRYTPMVAGDVNGDGSANDRAFIFDPATTTDSRLAAEMETLFGTLRGNGRACLLGQLGKIATRGSCQGPWRQNVSANFNISGKALRMGDRLSVNVYMQNVLGGIDRLFHGSQGLRGWGNTSFADRTLLTPIGFDAARNQFRYQVNPRFGDTRPSHNVFRSPFQISLSVNMRLGPSIEESAFRRSIRDIAAQTDSVLRAQRARKEFIGTQLLPLDHILQLKDSIRLTHEQQGAILVLRSELFAWLDTLWTPFAERIAMQGKSASLKAERETLKTLERDGDKFWRRTGVRLQAILSPEQWSMLGRPIRERLSGRETEIPRE